jgi:hypothetical protein
VIYRLPFEFTGTSWVLLTEDIVLFAGSCTEETASNEVYTYSLSSQELERKTPMLSKRVGGASYRLGKIVYIFGG